MYFAAFDVYEHKLNLISSLGPNMLSSAWYGFKVLVYDFCVLIVLKNSSMIRLHARILF